MLSYIRKYKTCASYLGIYNLTGESFYIYVKVTTQGLKDEVSFKIYLTRDRDQRALQ